MQTFMLSTDYAQTAAWLDNQRLGKQRVECLQILKALTDPDYGWQNHPAVKMWRGWETSLVDYSLTICKEWTVTRGKRDTVYNQIVSIAYEWGFDLYIPNYPDWITDEFCSVHRAIMLGKAQESKDKGKDKIWQWYQQWGWTEEPATRNELGKWPYIWPTKEKAV